MRLTWLLSALLLLSTVAGCQYAVRRPPRPAIPAASEVASVRLTSIGSSLVHSYDVTLTTDRDIGALIDWLRQVDWSPSRATDLSNVGLAEVGTITVTLKDGTAHSFGLSGGCVIVNRWQWPAETDRLADIAKQGGARIP
jgi:hypothetical protein